MDKITTLSSSDDLPVILIDAERITDEQTAKISEIMRDTYKKLKKHVCPECGESAVEFGQLHGETYFSCENGHRSIVHPS